MFLGFFKALKEVKQCHLRPDRAELTGRIDDGYDDCYKRVSVPDWWWMMRLSGLSTFMKQI
jgi:hypothetical protein